MWHLSSQVFTDNSSPLSAFMIRRLAHGDSNNAQKFDCVNAIGVRSGTAKTRGNHHTGISDGFKVNQSEKTLSPLTCPCSDLKPFYVVKTHHRRLFTAPLSSITILPFIHLCVCKCVRARVSLWLIFVGRFDN